MHPFKAGIQFIFLISALALTTSSFAQPVTPKDDSTVEANGQTETTNKNNVDANGRLKHTSPITGNEDPDNMKKPKKKHAAKDAPAQATDQSTSNSQ